ncbi:hypothetical protein Cme02nite_70740 [Catellatospora methionotrophica]|uniref:Uncharacterized protein n=1 Tax=Catellatospora methionotrophica TaxID=121620 RepID=A0A8J3LG68_9ACTN|nr:hypothetical protein [Catellatospora methionotrophica]GIG18742.1 hypothetical protein Cme02nite_70740 [Catellatospora methionotrophica]
MYDTPRPDRRLLIAVDMENYSGRDNVLQYRAQQGFQQVLQAATAQLDIDRVKWMTQQGGDGELAILPADVDELKVVTRLTPIIDRLLRDHNRGLDPEARVRLRIAVHEGLVHLDGANGYPGEAVVTVCRLVDAAPLKAALRAFPKAHVALIVSDRIYQDVIRHYHDIRPDRFLQVTAEVPGKRFSADAWVFVPDEDVRTLPHHPPVHGIAETPASSPAQAPPPLSPATTTGQYFANVTTHGPAAFGNHNTVGPYTDRTEEKGRG